MVEGLGSIKPMKSLADKQECEIDFCVARLFYASFVRQSWV